MSKKRKIRVDLRKNRTKPPREQGWTRDFHEHGFTDDDSAPKDERVRAKGDLSRRRTIMADEQGPTNDAADTARSEMPSVDMEACLPGRVLKVQGLLSIVAANDGRIFKCALRRLLRSLVIDERSILATGDRVWFRPASADEGMIERIEPRHGLLTRASRGKEQVLVANVDQIVIVGSLAQPDLKPHLIDRYLVSAEQGHIKPIVCLNKVDLTEAADYQYVVGLYSQLGIPVLLASATTGHGVDQLRSLLKDRQTVFSGQSGVGKSSLLNAIEPGLNLDVAEVSEATEKGKHTTTTAQLLQLPSGGWVVDTPGIRQFALWDINSEELEVFFPEFRPYVPHCRFNGCTHRDEQSCAVREAVDLHRIAMQRYESYLGMYEGKGMD